MNNKKLLALIPVLLLTAALAAAPLWQEGKNETGAKKDNVKAPAPFKVTFIELGSVRCIPCKKMMPIMKEIEKEYGGQVKVVFHDVWTKEGKPYAARYKIKLIPTQVFLDKDGKEYFRHVGFFPKKDLVKVLKQQGVK
jgi:thioredoxin 1